MKIYDISQELFSSNVYPGDKHPEYKRISDMQNGASCNITELYMNAHNGTHVDAPRHFVKDGITIEQLPPETFVGKCLVVDADGPVTAEFIAKYRGVKRLLCKGHCFLTVEGAEALGENGMLLFGIETQSITADNPPKDVHVALLSRGVIALEGLKLTEVPCGEYILSAAPLKLGGSDGAPCRALLIAGEIE